MDKWVGDRMVEITEAEQNKGKNNEKKKVRTVSETSRTTQSTNIWIIWFPEEGEKKKGYNNIFERIIVENFPNMGKEIVTQVQEA